MLYFEKLAVWQKAMDWVVVLIGIAHSLPPKYQYSFGDQLRRAALSVVNNIAEGAGRNTTKDSGQFYAISKGSVYECVNIVILLEKISLINKSKCNIDKIHTQAEEIAKMLHRLIRQHQ